jgi:hypothetical protein
MYVPFDLATVVPDDDDQRGHDEENLALYSSSNSPAW